MVDEGEGAEKASATGHTTSTTTKAVDMGGPDLVVDSASVLTTRTPADPPV